MIAEEKHMHLLAHEFAIYCHGGEEFGQRFIATNPHCDWSMEKLWLSYVMKEKYGKSWNGQEWVGGK
jgi:hypothetical protein